MWRTFTLRWWTPRDRKHRPETSTSPVRTRADHATQAPARLVRVRAAPGADYQRLLLNLRPQVVEGSRWISRCASSFDRDHADIRSVIIGHAYDEHRDYEVLEQDYAACGGSLAVIQARQRNPGSEALHCFLMYRAGEANPVGLLGAMWIIEGLGEKMASDWAARIQALTGVGEDSTRFLRYHGSNDDSHMDKLYGLLDRVCTSEEVADDILRTAAVVSRLYALQLEETDVD